MKVKSIDIATALGLSKATVSLALNGKAGVNKETRQRVLECRERLEREYAREQKEKDSRRTIMGLIINHMKKVFADSEMDLLSGVLASMEDECRRRNYLFQVMYLNESEQNEAAVLAECNREHVRGVLVLGAEMQENDISFCREINKPLILLDYDTPEGEYTSVCIDNGHAVRLAFDYLWKNGCRKFKYIATSKPIYNFISRQNAFITSMLSHGCAIEKTDVLRMGFTISEMMANMERFFREKWDQEGLILENYQVSIATAGAVRRVGSTVLRNIHAVGIDAVPPYALGEISLPLVNVHHGERAALGVDLLIREIEQNDIMKSRILTVPFLVE